MAALAEFVSEELLVREWSVRRGAKDAFAMNSDAIRWLMAFPLVVVAPNVVAATSQSCGGFSGRNICMLGLWKPKPRKTNLRAFLIASCIEATLRLSATLSEYVRMADKNEEPQYLNHGRFGNRYLIGRNKSCQQLLPDYRGPRSV